MTMERKYDLVILGGGPGGYVAAIRASHLGLRAALIEKRDLGGVCLNIGCIPTKTLLRNAEVLSLFKNAGDFGISVDGLSFDYSKAVDRSRRIVKKLRKGIEFLLQKGDIDIIYGRGQLVSDRQIEVFNRAGELSETVEGDKIIIATGARPKSIKDFEIDGGKIISSNEALLLRDLPDRMIIIGGGAVGVEFAYLFSTYGVKITLLEAMDHILPEEDSEVADILKKSLKKKGIEVLTGVSIKEKKTGGTVQVLVESKEGDKKIEADSVLVAVGREPNTEGLGIEKIGVNLHNGFIKIDKGLETNVPGIYAIGDVAGPPLLAHKAMAEGVLAAETIAGQTDDKSIDKDSIPRCVYTNPQVAGIGLTEKEAVKAGHEVKVGRFPFRANGKALAMGETEGLVKIVSDAKSDEILGAQLIGPEVTEILGEITLARVFESTSYELSKIIHPHPSLSEAILEAAGAISGKAIHI